MLVTLHLPMIILQENICFHQNNFYLAITNKQTINNNVYSKCSICFTTVIIYRNISFPIHYKCRRNMCRVLSRFLYINFYPLYITRHISSNTPSTKMKIHEYFKQLRMPYFPPSTVCETFIFSVITIKQWMQRIRHGYFPFHRNNSAIKCDLHKINFSN